MDPQLSQTSHLDFAAASILPAIMLSTCWMYLFFAACLAVTGDHAAQKPVTVFYIPHQDDEVLSMSVGIVNHLWHGHDVHVVLYTDGKPSDYAANNLNRDLRNNGGFEPLTKDEMVTVRNDEFYRSCLAMGVTHENIHIDPVSALNKSNLKDLILRYEDYLNKPNHKAMSYRDLARSHSVSGQALNELYNAGQVAKPPRFYIRLIQMESTLEFSSERGNSPVISGNYEGYRAEYQPYIAAAANQYLITDDKETMFQLGFYAFGEHSVGTKRFNSIKNNPRSKYHLPNA